MQIGRVTRNAVFQSCMLLFFCVALNADWKASSLFWWGSVGLLIIGYVCRNDGGIVVDFSKFDAWWLGFIAVTSFSIVYALSTAAVVGSLKTFVIMFAGTYLIGKTLKSKNDVEAVMAMLLIALLCVVAYIYLKVDLNSFVLTRVGEADTGRWNANDVGIMTTIGIILAMYFFRERHGTMTRMILLLCIVAFALLDVITASRKAIIMLLLGICASILLLNPRKMIRNILWVVIILCVSYYAITEIPALYDLIGWRMEGMFAGISGEAEADSSTVYRQKMLDAAFQVFRENPIFGCGMDNFRYYNPIRVTYAHNNFAEIAADLGCIGLLSYYWIYVYVFFDYFTRVKKDALLTTLFVFVGVYLISHYAMVTTTDMIQNTLLCCYLAYSQISRRKVVG